MRLIDADEIRIKPEYMHDICGVAMIRVEDIARILNDMPTIQPEPHWIPCSEKLPEEEEDVLVTRTFLGVTERHGWNEHLSASTYVEVAQYFAGTWTALSDEYKVARNRHTDPIAWMPLPEPYQPEEK